MTTLATVRRLPLTLACLLIASAAAFAQAQATQPFEPQVGQQGKDVVWVPTGQIMVEKMLDMAQVTAQDVVLDLGSGDGRTVIAAAKRGARARGIEYNPQMVELSRQNAANQGVAGKATFEEADLFETDLSQATVITMFLLPDINLKLRPEILELEPGTRIVSNTFTMGEWEPEETAKVEGDCRSWCTALLWIVPANVEGTWRVPEGEITLAQSFQMISGTLRANGRDTTISGRLRGEEISFTAGDQEYTGRVSGNTMEGTVTANGGSQQWSARRGN